MNIENIDDYMIPIITAGALCIGFVMKKWMPSDDKWIPTVLLILGALSGIFVCGLSYEGIVKGMVSGLAAVGLHQVFKQHMKLDEDEKIQTRFNSDGPEMLESYTDEQISAEEENEAEEEPAEK